MTADTRSELRTGLLVTIGVLAASLPVAVLWRVVAPLPHLVVRGDGIFLTGGQSEVQVAADGWFAVCTATAGLVAALVVFARIPRARLGALLGLTVGGLLAAVVAWRLGVLLGPGSVRHQAQGIAEGGRFDGPLAISARGVLFAWPLASVVAYFALTAGLEPPAANRAGGGQRFPVTVLRPGYAIADVDAAFDRLDAGELAPDELAGLRLRPSRWRQGYDEASVDAALAQRLAALSSPGQVDGSARSWPG